MYGSVSQCVQPPLLLGRAPQSGRRVAGLVPAYYVGRMLGFVRLARSCLPYDFVIVLLRVALACFFAKHMLESVPLVRANLLLPSRSPGAACTIPVRENREPC